MKDGYIQKNDIQAAMPVRVLGDGRSEVNKGKMPHSPLYRDSTLCNLLLGEEGPIGMELE
jgi:hypothetical protein